MTALPIDYAATLYKYGRHPLTAMPTRRLAQLRDEYSRLEGSFPQCAALLEHEIVRLERKLHQQVDTVVRRVALDGHAATLLGRIVGPRGATIQAMEQRSGCRLQVRGKGTERRGQRPSDEGLHVVVTFEGPREGAIASLSLAERLIADAISRAS